MKRLLSLITTIFFFTQSFAQISVTTTSTLTETFAIGTSSSASLPTGWKMSSAGNGNSSNWTTTSNVTNVTRAANSGSPANGGRYNWGTSSTERAIGFMGGSSPSYSSPNSIMAHYQNNTGKLITSITMSFGYERYRINTGGASVTFFTSTDGENWTARTSGDSGPFTTSTSSSYTFSSPTVINRSVTISNLAILNEGNFYVRWVFTHASNTTSQGIGLDNVNFTPTANPAILVSSTTTSTFTTTYGTPSSVQNFIILGYNLNANVIATAPTGYEVSIDGTNFGTTATFTQSSGLVIGSLSVRLSVTTPVIGTYNSRNVSLASTGATTINITTPTTGNLVNPKNLTITDLSFPNKVYDGTTTIVPTGIPSYVGLVNGQSFVVTGVVTWNLTSSNVGNSISIIRSGNYNAPSTNYTVTQPSGFTSNIIKANQTITFNSLPYKTTLDVNFDPIVTTTSGLPLTFTSSDPNVATIVGGKIKIMGIGTTTITASQPGNSNYFAAVSQTSELFVDEPVTRWSFDALTINGTGQTPIITQPSADIGQQTENTVVSGFHNSASTNWTSPVGNGNLKSLSANTWQVDDYFRFTVNTQFITIIKLTFDQTSSSTGPKDFKLQYSLDGNNFTDITTYTVPFNTNTNTDYSWGSTNYQSASTLSFDLSSITEINDLNSVQFRLTNTSTSALLGGTIQTGGTSRVDNFTMFGNMDIPLPLNIISFSGKTFGSQNRLQWTLSEWGKVEIQKYIKGTWVKVGETDSNVWIDTNPYKGLSYYRILSDRTFSQPIYVNNIMGYEESSSDFKYYDMGGKNLNKVEPNQVIIRKTEFTTDKVIMN
jgi:hypothetical protein